MAKAAGGVLLGVGEALMDIPLSEQQRGPSFNAAGTPLPSYLAKDTTLHRDPKIKYPNPGHPLPFPPESSC